MAVSIPLSTLQNATHQRMWFTCLSSLNRFDSQGLEYVHLHVSLCVIHCSVDQNAGYTLDRLPVHHSES